MAIPIYARIMRSSVLSVRESDFVTASRALGESQLRAPAAGGSCPTRSRRSSSQGTLGIGAAVLEIAALSFLGLGGAAAARRVGLDDRPGAQPVFTAPHLILFPGIALTLTVLGFNLLGDGLRDALDPRLNR